MRHAPEALLAFAEAAQLGSFSAAARKLGKRQSTVSEAIANLEIDLGVRLFDRATRTPTLTDAGRALLPQVQRALEAGAAIDRIAARLAHGEEARLTLVVSDTYQSKRYEETLMALERRFPALELECQIAEHDDVLDLIQQGRAQLGLMAARAVYPADIGAATVAEESEIGLFVGRMHALAAYGDAEVPHAALRDARELRLNTYVKPEDQRAEDRIVVGTQRWLAPSYLMLLEMAVLGFGWAELPRW
ncbi:LysR family transcriptional regulator, partial [Burkholderia vietnamiensis]